MHWPNRMGIHSRKLFQLLPLLTSTHHDKDSNVEQMGWYPDSGTLSAKGIIPASQTRITTLLSDESLHGHSRYYETAVHLVIINCKNKEPGFYFQKTRV